MPEIQAADTPQGDTWDARVTWICAEAGMTTLQARVFRAMLTSGSLHELALELYGPLCLDGLTRQQTVEALERAGRQATGLALAGVQAVARIDRRFPEARQDGARWAREVLACARNRCDWHHDPIGGDQHLSFGDDAQRTSAQAARPQVRADQKAQALAFARRAAA